MNIVLEGPDGGGKSTLAKKLNSLTRMPIIAGEGPAKSADEITERASRMNQLDWVIFDRHPVVSSHVYEWASERKWYVHPAETARFYMKKPLFIYCRPSVEDAFNSMTFGPDESERQKQLVRNRFAQIVERYDVWARQHADLWYRKDQGQALDFLMAGIQQMIVTA